MTLWFGHFYRPAYDGRAFADQAMDSKARADFQARYAGEEASPCVARQEYMMASACPCAACGIPSQPPASMRRGRGATGPG